MWRMWAFWTAHWHHLKALAYSHNAMSLLSMIGLVEMSSYTIIDKLILQCDANSSYMTGWNINKIATSMKQQTDRPDVNWCILFNENPWQHQAECLLLQRKLRPQRQMSDSYPLSCMDNTCDFPPIDCWLNSVIVVGLVVYRLKAHFDRKEQSIQMSQSAVYCLYKVVPLNVGMFSAKLNY